jgi:hypothetical protein
MIRGLWPWIVLALLGAYHGINPGMGWLFAVGRGLQEGSRQEVVRSLLPIAVGHELSVAAVVLLLGGAEATAPARTVRVAAAAALIGFGLWKLARPNRHPTGFSSRGARPPRRRVGVVGLRLNRTELAGWSFLMSSAHGAGLMLVPVLVGLGGAEAAGHDHAADVDLAHLSLLDGAAAVVVHTAAMLAVMGVVAVVVYDKVGLGILRKAWVNMDLLWAGALVTAGVFTLFT